MSSMREADLRARTLCLACALWLVATSSVEAQQSGFHDAPASSASFTNPYQGVAAAENGRELYGANCASCHGSTAQGSGNIPPLAHSAVQTVTDGELFWFITTGSVKDGMPSWSALPEQQRWQIVTYLKTLVTAPGATAAAAAPRAPIGDAPPPPAPFTDFRFERPGNTRHITVDDLPAPFASPSAANAATVVARPQNAMPQAPAGFKVGLYAQGLEQPRVIHTAPNGDIFVAESGAGRIRVFRGMNARGEPERSEIFAGQLKKPYGIAFYPQGAHPHWVYVADTEAVRRFPYRNGDLHARAAPERILELPYAGGHWTRDLSFSLDGRTLFVAVGSHSNIDDPDATPAEQFRANILAFDPDGSHQRIYASGIRNPSGLAVDPDNGQLWCTVNERDGLGDNLVPDYITSVREGGFYGWPWWYMGGHQDPRHAGKHPELQSQVIVPDVLLQPHDASLQIAFYRSTKFPKEYAGDIFATQHGSWNKSVRAGYEVIRIPRHHTSRASGEYQDFLTGFVMPDGQVWGRPVGITVARDGSLLVTDDGSNSIWRIDYVGP